MLAMRDLAWASGFFEGEGSFGCPRTTPQIQVVQVNREPLERLASIFGGKIYACSGRGKGRAYFMWAIYGHTAAGLMMTVFTFMSARRRAQILKALAPWKAAASRPSTHSKRRFSPGLEA